MSQLRQSQNALSIRQAAEKLQISPATLRNWIRLGRVAAVRQNQRLCVEAEEIKRVRNGLASGEFAGLDKFANKRAGKKHFLSEPADECLRLGKFVEQNRIRPVDAVLLALLAQLTAHGEFQPGVNRFRRSAAAKLLAGDAERLQGNWESEFFLRAKEVENLPELLLQYLSSGGGKASSGAFYTPEKLVEDAVSSLPPPTLQSRFGDPCCGTGRYLTAAIRRGFQPENVFGFEISPLAAKIASIQVLLAVPELDFSPRIFIADALRSREIVRRNGTFDAIATNPPWGKAPDTPGGEDRFASFLRLAYRLLRENGSLSFLLPLAMAQTETHRDIRLFLLKNMELRRMILLGCPFGYVFTPVVRLDAIKRQEPFSGKIQMESPECQYEISQTELLQTSDLRFPLDTPPADREIRRKIEHFPHDTLAGHARWAIGIVTGNNREILHREPLPGDEPVLTGKDIDTGTLLPPSHFLKFQPQNFQQCPPEEFFRHPEKLVYKFIARYPVVGCDHLRRLTLNSANILLPELPGWSSREVMVYLNSLVARFFHFSRSTGLKVLKKDLETIPFPHFSAVQKQRFTALADTDNRNAVDLFLLEVFGLNEKEYHHMKERIFPTGKTRSAKTPSAASDQTLS